HGLCGPQRLSLHLGDDLVSPRRFVHRRAQAALAASSPVWRKSPSFTAGSRFFQRRGRALLAGRSHPIFDAAQGGRTTPTPGAQSAPRRAAVLRAETQWPGSSYLAERRTTSEREGLRLLPKLRRPKTKAWPPRARLCLLGVSPWFDPLDSADL